MSIDSETMGYLEARYDEFDELYDNDFALQNLHMEYIYEHNDPTERVICNGDDLIVAMEQGYLYEAFRDDYISNMSV